MNLRDRFFDFHCSFPNDSKNPGRNVGKTAERTGISLFPVLFFFFCYNSIKNNRKRPQKFNISVSQTRIFEIISNYSKATKKKKKLLHLNLASSSVDVNK